MNEDTDKNIKVADNRKLDENELPYYREKINDIENQIDYEKDKMRNLDDMEDIFVSLNNNINKCVEILRKSIKGKNTANKLNSIEENNKINFKKSIGNIEIEKEETKNNIINLYTEKDNIQKEIRDKYNEKKYDDNLKKEEIQHIY